MYVHPGSTIPPLGTKGLQHPSYHASNLRSWKKIQNMYVSSLGVQSVCWVPKTSAPLGPFVETLSLAKHRKHVCMVTWAVQSPAVRLLTSVKVWRDAKNIKT
jgi:hypothetical protein